ncbi:hypothetical protein SLA2020_214650 [Shorea laevis]
MKEALAPPTEVPFSFPPRRRPHLKSQTYHNLVQIVSLCYGQSPLASAPPIIPLDLISEKGRREDSQATGKETETGDVVRFNNEEPGELVVSDSGQTENLQKEMVFDENLQITGISNRGSSNTQMAIEEIEKMMEIEENRDPLNQNDMVVRESSGGTALQVKDLGLEQMLMNVLENIMKGNEEHDQGDGIDPSAVSVDENQSGGDVAASMNDQQQEGNINHQEIIMEESGPTGLGEVGQEDLYQPSPESADLSSDRIFSVVLTKSEVNEDKSPLAKTIEDKEGHEIQPKGMKCEKPFYSHGMVTAPSHMVEDGEIEEGEISGEDGNELLTEDAVVSGQKNLDENQVHVGIVNNELLFDKQNRSNVLDSVPTLFTMNAVDNEKRGRKVEQEEGVQNQMVCEPKEVYRKGNGTKHGSGSLLAWPNNLTLHKEVLKQGGDKEAITSQEKDTGASKRKKRSCTKERKERKKKRDRKKRAENNQKLGVKRLKLEPVLKPKTIRVCRHYLVGKCHEGENCKFSHNAEPVTKSTPCSFFIVGNCMKGDDCPYDHQLSKHPCHNFVSKGFCPRGDSCLFSHKISAPKDSPSSSNAIGTELKPLLPSNSKFEKQLSIGGTKIQRAESSSPSLVVSTHKNKKQNVAEILPVPPSVTPKGVSCFSVAKSPVPESSILKQGSLLPKWNETGKVENQTNKCATDTVQTVNESPKITPSVVPRGINFLSFGKAISRDSSGKNEAALPLGGNEHKESPNEGGKAGTGNQTTQSASSKEREVNQMLKISQPALVPTGINFLSLGKALKDDQRNHREASLPSSSQCDKGESSQENQHASIKQSNLSALSWNWPASPLAPGQSPNSVHKKTQNSVQKAVVSTLAFAEKFDSERKTKRSTSSACSVGTQVNGETVGATVPGWLQNDSKDASKFLEFLSSFGSKRKL